MASLLPEFGDMDAARPFADDAVAGNEGGPAGKDGLGLYAVDLVFRVACMATGGGPARNLTFAARSSISGFRIAGGKQK